MLLTRLHKVQAKLQREHSPERGHNKRFGHTLIRMFSSSLSDDLKMQHKLHVIDEIRLLTLPSYKIHKVTKDIEDLGVTHHAARVILIANNFDYHKAVTQLVTHVLSTLDYEERRLTSLAIARLIEPADTLLEMDCVLSIMLRTPTGNLIWKVLGDNVNELLEERACRRQRRLKAQYDMKSELREMRGEDFNMEQD